MMPLRPYQLQSVEQIRYHFSQGKKKVLLHLATGGGKTMVFCEIMRLVRDKGNRAMMVVRGKDLVNQPRKGLTERG